MHHPRTTLVGIATALCTLATAFGWLTSEQATAVGGVLTAVLALCAADGRP